MPGGGVFTVVYRHTTTEGASGVSDFGVAWTGFHGLDFLGHPHSRVWLYGWRLYYGYGLWGKRLANQLLV